MNKQGRIRSVRGKKQLELAFYELWMRLSLCERERLAEQFTRPHRRQWLIIDEHGMRPLD
jgi:hypothetical protein